MTKIIYSRKEIKTPTLLNLKQLEPGDILLFRPSTNYYHSQGIITFVQCLLKRVHGHYDTVHAAVCVGKDENNNPIIAHSTRKNKTFGYVKEPILEMMERDQDDRPFLIFRHENKKINQEIANIASDEKNNKKQKWSYRAASYAIFCRDNVKSKKQEQKTKLKNRNTCSQFAFECLKVAYTRQNLSKIELSSYISPKTLESYLYKHKQFTNHVYLGEKPLERIRKEIEAQIKRISEQDSLIAKRKAKNISILYRRQLIMLGEQPNKNNWEKICQLLSAVLPAFNESTGIGWFNTTSYTKISRLARKMGIFNRDIKQYEINHQQKTSLLVNK